VFHFNWKKRSKTCQVVNYEMRKEGSSDVYESWRVSLFHH
jgi:hypothetical protein